MKDNNLGIMNSQTLKEIEYYLFNIKYHIIDENYTFNEEDMFNAKYLEKIHLFLFNDIYALDDCKIKKDAELEEINRGLKGIKYMLYNNDTKNLKEEIRKIWEQQIFYDGNTRTLLCYLKILSNVFDFNITYDFTKDVDKDYFIDEVLESIEVEAEKSR